MIYKSILTFSLLATFSISVFAQNSNLCQGNYYEEAEAAQLVIRPRTSLKGLTARVEDLQNADGTSLSAENVDILRVGYLPVTQPTDAIGVAAHHGIDDVHDSRGTVCSATKQRCQVIEIELRCCHQNASVVRMCMRDQVIPGPAMRVCDATSGADLQ